METGTTERNRDGSDYETAPARLKPAKIKDAPLKARNRQKEIVAFAVRIPNGWLVLTVIVKYF
jgi:hypothetical protein